MTAVAVGASIYFIAIVFGIYYLVAFYFGDAEYPFIDFQWPDWLYGGMMIGTMWLDVYRMVD